MLLYPRNFPTYFATPCILSSRLPLFLPILLLYSFNLPFQLTTIPSSLLRVVRVSVSACRSPTLLPSLCRVRPTRNRLFPLLPTPNTTSCCGTPGGSRCKVVNCISDGSSARFLLLFLPARHTAHGSCSTTTNRFRVRSSPLYLDGQPRKSERNIRAFDASYE